MVPKEKLEQFWNENNEKINRIGGKLLVPVMNIPNPLLKEAHQDLLNYMHWFDRTMEKLLEGDQVSNI